MRNYGDGGDGRLNQEFAAGSADGTFLGVPFFCRLIAAGEGPAELSGQGFRQFSYEIQSSASGRTAMAVTMYKIYPVGY